MGQAPLAHVAGADPWAWNPHPEVWLLVAVVAVAYLRALRRLGPRHSAPGTPVATTSQKLAFGAGLAALWAFSDWPVHEVGEGFLFSVHMTQHTVFSLVVPPLLLLGTPAWMLDLLLRPPWLRAVVGRLTRPVFATVVFNVVVVVSHLPPWVEVTVRNELAHFVAHAVLVGAAFLVWLPVVHQVRGLPALSHPLRMLHLFVQSIVPTVPASFLAFAEKPLYDAYVAAPRRFGLSAVEDQQLAGAVMKVGGGALLWGAIIVLFFHWYSLTQRDQGDVLTWDDVERELARTPPARP